jgi:ABC-type antimicrobial peptide transport system permease subunit
MALGANRGNVVNLVLREAGLLLVVGLGAGTGLAIVAGQTATSMLFGLKPTDPITIGLSVALFALVGLLASILPAVRAARLDPMVALREE